MSRSDSGVLASNRCGGENEIPIENLFEAGREVGLEPDLDNKSIIKNKTNFRENVLKKHFFSLILVY